MDRLNIKWIHRFCFFFVFFLSDVFLLLMHRIWKQLHCGRNCFVYRHWLEWETRQTHQMEWNEYIVNKCKTAIQCDKSKQHDTHKIRIQLGLCWIDFFYLSFSIQLASLFISFSLFSLYASNELHPCEKWPKLFNVFGIESKISAQRKYPEWS